MKVLVYGASGSQQSPVIQALIEKGAEVIATTHQPLKAESLRKHGAEPVVVDMADRERVFEITQGIDAVSLLIPFFLPDPLVGLSMAKNVIDAAVKENVKLLVWNSSGFIEPVRLGIPAIDVRLDIVDYLKQSGLPHIIIQPSVYAENLLGPWTAPFIAKERIVTYPTPEAMRVGWIATQDVANLVAQAIFSPHLAGNSFRVSGTENLNGGELAEQFSSALGKDLAFKQMPPKAFGQILDGMLGEGAGKGAENMYQQITDSGHYPTMHNPDMDEVLRQLPVEMTSVAQWVSQHKHAFDVNE